jgi:hypothetical protein
VSEITDTESLEVHAQPDDGLGGQADQAREHARPEPAAAGFQLGAIVVLPLLCAVTFFVALKVPQRFDERRRTQTACEHLAAIDVDCTVLAGVIDLEDAIADRLSGLEPGNDHRGCYARDG